jgi:hypothetical protein
LLVSNLWPLISLCLESRVDPALRLMLSVIKVPRLPMTSVSFPSVEASWSSRTDEPAAKVPIVGDEPDLPRART